MCVWLFKKPQEKKHNGSHLNDWFCSWMCCKRARGCSGDASIPKQQWGYISGEIWTEKNLLKETDLCRCGLWVPVNNEKARTCFSCDIFVRNSINSADRFVGIIVFFYSQCQLFFFPFWQWSSCGRFIFHVSFLGGTRMSVRLTTFRPYQ